MKNIKIVLPKPNTNLNIDTSFSSRQLHFDDEKNGILNIVKFNNDHKDSIPKPRTKSSTPKPRTKSSTLKPRTKSSTLKPRTKSSTPKPRTKSSTPKQRTKSSRDKL